LTRTISGLGADGRTAGPPSPLRKIDAATATLAPANYFASEPMLMTNDSLAVESKSKGESDLRRIVMQTPRSSFADRCAMGNFLIEHLAKKMPSSNLYR
jgi:hypothetical protein